MRLYSLLAALFGAFLIVFFPGWLAGQGFAPSREAIEACSGINPAGAWRDCVEKYDQKLEQLRQDPQWQARQRELRFQQMVELLKLELQRQQIQLQRQTVQELQRMHREGTLPSRVSPLCRDAIARGDSMGISMHCLP